MMRAAPLKTMVRVEDLRLVRARRALADALTAEDAARAAQADADGAVESARRRWVAADADFRRHPQCQQRAWLRDLANERLLAAVDAALRAREAHDEARAATSAARAALSREEERATHLEGLHRSARAAEREVHETREEEDRMTQRVDA